MIQTVYLALGSNLGMRQDNLSIAKEKLSTAVNVVEESLIYETPPWGVLDQPAFLNQVIKGETPYNPMKLLEYIKRIEIEMGRVKNVRFGPRIIDIDIIFYENFVINEPGLQIPHPRLRGRAFVLLPLNDIAPDFYHPVLNMSTSELLQETDTTEIKCYQCTEE